MHIMITSVTAKKGPLLNPLPDTETIPLRPAQIKRYTLG